jgi:hypothetical protein
MGTDREPLIPEEQRRMKSRYGFLRYALDLTESLLFFEWTGNCSKVHPSHLAVLPCRMLYCFDLYTAAATVRCFADQLTVSSVRVISYPLVPSVANSTYPVQTIYLSGLNCSDLFFTVQCHYVRTYIEHFSLKCYWN